MFTYFIEMETEAQGENSYLFLVSCSPGKLQLAGFS